MAPKCLLAILSTILLVSGAYAAQRTPTAEWRTYINDACIIADEPFLLPEADEQTAARAAPMLGMIATKMASTLVGSIISGLTGRVSDRAASRDTEYIAANDFDLYVTDLSESPTVNLNPRMGCITMVSAQFQPDTANCTDAYVPRTITVDALELPESEWQTDRTDNSAENILQRANVCVAGQAKSVFEARIEFSEDRTAYRMKNAGYWINSLSSTKSTRASRNLLYTLEIVEPSEGSAGRVLSTAWVDLGMVSAGDTAADGGSVDRSDWLSIPAMSRSARRAFETDTAAHQEVAGEIEALERAVLRDARQLAGIENRAGSSSNDVLEVLEKEMTKLSVGIIKKESMLEARRAEYDDLQQPTLRYMPVTMRVGITESRSSRRAMQALSYILTANQEVFTEVANDVITIDRSLNLDTDEADLGSLRQDYYDALVAVDAVSPDSGQEQAELEMNLAAAKNSYNSARTAAGLDPIE